MLAAQSLERASKRRTLSPGTLDAVEIVPLGTRPSPVWDTAPAQPPSIPASLARDGYLYAEIRVDAGGHLDDLLASLGDEPRAWQLINRHRYPMPHVSDDTNELEEVVHAHIPVCARRPLPAAGTARTARDTHVTSVAFLASGDPRAATQKGDTSQQTTYQPNDGDEQMDTYYPTPAHATRLRMAAKGKATAAPQRTMTRPTGSLAATGKGAAKHTLLALEPAAKST
eukprot:jgi/Tetstr1/422587/TSEL_013394.t1